MKHLRNLDKGDKNMPSQCAIEWPYEWVSKYSEVECQACITLARNKDHYKNPHIAARLADLELKWRGRA